MKMLLVFTNISFKKLSQDSSDVFQGKILLRLSEDVTFGEIWLQNPDLFNFISSCAVAPSREQNTGGGAVSFREKQSL